MYVDYEYYTKVFGGKLIPEDDFTYYINQADDYVDYITLTRVHKFKGSPFDNKIKRAYCSLAEIYYEEQQSKESVGAQAGSKGIRSETVGSHTVSFQKVDGESKMKDTANYDALRYRVARQHLLPTGLLYRGL